MLNHIAGVILSHEPAPIESRQFATSDKVNSAGIFVPTSGNNNNNSNNNHNNNNNMPKEVPIMVYVPHTLDGQLKIENLNYRKEYANASSPFFQEMAKDFEQKLETSLSDSRIFRIKVLKMM